MIEKKIQIPKTLFTEIYLLCTNLLDPDTEVTAEEVQAIIKQIETKAEAIKKREIYTAYKTSKTEAERESARSEYVKRVGVSERHCW
jgi:uncharacterized FlgJ-related protein